MRLGLNLNKDVFRGTSAFSGLLDDLDLANDSVFAVAVKKLTRNYSGIAFRLVDSSTLDEQNFYFKGDGTFDFSAVDSWVTGTPLVKRWGNQFKEDNYAYQNTVSKMPTLDTTNERIIFDGSGDQLDIDDYTEIQFTTFPFSIYMNMEINDTGTDYVFVKNLDSLGNVVWGVRKTSGTIDYMLTSAAYSPVSYGTGNNKYIGSWASYAANQIKTRVDGTTQTGTRNTGITNQPNLTIGNRRSASFYFNGDITTIIVFNTDEYSSYQDLVDGGV